VLVRTKSIFFWAIGVHGRALGVHGRTFGRNCRTLRIPTLTNSTCRWTSCHYGWTFGRYGRALGRNCRTLCIPTLTNSICRWAFSHYGRTFGLHSVTLCIYCRATSLHSWTLSRANRSGSGLRPFLDNYRIVLRLSILVPFGRSGTTDCCRTLNNNIIEVTFGITPAVQRYSTPRQTAVIH